MPKAKSITNKRKPNKNKKKTKKIDRKNRKHKGGSENENKNNNNNTSLAQVESAPVLDTNKNKIQVSYRYAGIEFITIGKDFEIDKKDIALYEMHNIPYIKLSDELQQGLDRDEKYVLVVYDDNSYVSPEQLNQYKNKTPPYYLHLVVEYTKEYKYGLIKLDYAPLTPPDNSGPHNYIFQLYLLDSNNKLNENKLSIIEHNSIKRSIHSEEYNHLDYLLVLLGLSTGDKPIETVQFKVNTNNSQPLPSSNVAPSPVVQNPNEALPVPEAQPQDGVKVINLNGEQPPANHVESEQSNEVNDAVLDAQAEHGDLNEEREKKEIDPNEDNDNDNNGNNDNEIENEFANIENPPVEKA